jgi:acyl-CoA thioester hydrolase
MTKSKIFALPVRVYFQDTDAGGVVYHANYLNFMERARTEWLRAHGHSNAGLMKEFGVVFVVRSMKIDYLRPALLDDSLDVTVQIKDIGRSRLTLTQSVRRQHGVAEQSGREPPLHGAEVLTEAEVHLVCVSLASFKPASVPDVLRTQLEK